MHDRCCFIRKFLFEFARGHTWLPKNEEDLSDWLGNGFKKKVNFVSKKIDKIRKYLILRVVSARKVPFLYLLFINEIFHWKSLLCLPRKKNRFIHKLLIIYRATILKTKNFYNYLNWSMSSWTLSYYTLFDILVEFSSTKSYNVFILSDCFILLLLRLFFQSSTFKLSIVLYDRSVRMRCYSRVRRSGEIN